MLLPSPTPSLILFIGLGLEAANNQSARALSSIKRKVQENEERLMKEKETESTSFFLVITLSSIVIFFGLRLMIEQVMTWLAAVSSLIGDRDSQPGLTSGYKRFPLPSTVSRAGWLFLSSHAR